MIKANPWETELNAIRLKLYEETKNLTVEERVRQTNERGQRLAAQYGFKIGRPADSRDQSMIQDSPRSNG